MRPQILAAVVVSALATLVPNAVSGGRFHPAPDVPKVSVALRLPPSAPPAAPPRAVTKRATALPEPKVRHTPKALAQPAAPRPRLIREWHVLYTRSGSTQERSNASPCPRASTCDRYQFKNAKWPTDSSGNVIIPFAYNDEDRRPARAADGITKPSIQAAMSQWSHWNSNIVFRDTGPTTATFAADGKDGTCDDGTNVITWGRFDPEVIGAAVLCFDESGHVIRDADLALNEAQHWERVSGTPESRHSHDIQSILTHELGHWLGFEDIYSGDAVRQTMFGNTAYGEINKRTLALGDIVGIQKAYPCGGGDRCPRSGVVDD
jgi:hypothetical protein